MNPNIMYSLLHWKVNQDNVKVVLDSLRMAFRDENDILDQMYEK